MSFLLWSGAAASLLIIAVVAILLAPLRNAWPLRCGWQDVPRLHQKPCASCDGEGQQVLGPDGWESAGPPPPGGSYPLPAAPGHVVHRIIRDHQIANLRDCPRCQGFGFTWVPAEKS